MNVRYCGARLGTINIPSSADHGAGGVDRLADGARAVGDGQGGRL